MRLIDADVLKEKLVKIQKDIVNQTVARGSAKSDAWKAAYLLIIDEYIKMLDEMPSEMHNYDCNHDCDAIYEAYNRGYSKGREEALIAEECKKKYWDINRKMEEQAKKADERLLQNDCNVTEETRKALNITREEIWGKIIQDLKTLEQEADDKAYVPYMTDALAMTALRLYYTDVTNGTIKQDDKSHMWSLVDDLGCYSIKGETIMYLPEYQEIKKLIKKIF